MPHLKNKTFTQRILLAGKWTLGGHALAQIIRFGSNLFMTRMLAPDMFGVMAIALMVRSGLTMFSDIGLRQNIVRSMRGNEIEFLNTAWIVQISRGFLIFLVALAVSCLIQYANQIGSIPLESVYAHPTLPHVIILVSFSAIFMGFESTKLLVASRELNLSRVTTIEIISQIFGFLLMALWVLIDRSIWALVVGVTISSLVKTVLSHVYLQGQNNSFRWSKSDFQEIFHFGKWIFFSSILGFMVLNGDRLLLGSMVTTEILGIYVIAFFLAHAVEEGVTKIISQVCLPALSEIARTQPTALRDRYYRFRFFLGVISNFCAGFLAVSGNTLVQILYDERYSDAGWILEILAISLLTVPFRVSAQCFIALGAPNIVSHMAAMRLTALITLLPLGAHFWGLPGAIWGIVLSSFSVLPMTIYYKFKYSLLDFKRELQPLPAAIIGAILAIPINALS